MSRHPQSGRMAGFTILELMIAMSVLSVLLLMVSAVFIGIGNSYTKGVYTSRLQDQARGLIQDISGTIQFSTAAVTTSGAQTMPGSLLPETAYCIGGLRYSFTTDRLPGTALTGGATLRHALWQDSFSGANCSPVDLTQDTPSAGGHDPGLKQEGIHIFSITNAGSLNTISVDFFAAPDITMLNLPSGRNANCSGGAGQQYCTTAHLSTTVEQRLSGS